MFLRLSHRLVVELLSERVDELYQFTRRHALEPPLMGDEKHASLIKALNHIRLADIISDKSGLSATRPAVSSNVESAAPEPQITGSVAPAQPSMLDFPDDLAMRQSHLPSVSEMNMSLDADDLNQPPHLSPENQVEPSS